MTWGPQNNLSYVSKCDNIIRANDDNMDDNDDDNSDDDNIRPSWATVANSIDFRPFLAESSAHVVGPIKFT